MNIHQNLFQWPIKTRQKNLSFWLVVILNPIQILFTGSNLNQTYVFRLQDLNTPSLCIYLSPWQPLGQRRPIEPVLDKVLEKEKKTRAWLVHVAVRLNENWKSDSCKLKAVSRMQTSKFQQVSNQFLNKKSCWKQIVIEGQRLGLTLKSKLASSPIFWTYLLTISGGDCCTIPGSAV